MASSKPGSFFLRSTSALSLNERFSQILWDQLARPRVVTFDPVQRREMCGSPPSVLLMKEEPVSLGLQDVFTELLPGDSRRINQRLRTRISVWTRLGRRKLPRRFSAFKPRGFWSFRNKYIHRRWGSLRTRLRQRGLWKKTVAQKRKAGPHRRPRLPSGRPAVSKGRGHAKREVQTKRQLDAQLEDYMSKSKRQLDKQLDDYMSMSRRRLDAELDEYMLMAGDSKLQWG